MNISYTDAELAFQKACERYRAEHISRYYQTGDDDSEGSDRAWEQMVNLFKSGAVGSMLNYWIILATVLSEPAERDDAARLDAMLLSILHNTVQLLREMD